MDLDKLLTCIFRNFGFFRTEAPTHPTYNLNGYTPYRRETHVMSNTPSGWDNLKAASRNPLTGIVLAICAVCLIVCAIVLRVLA
ncbi:hypothetical protein [Nonomuraea sp. NPDC049158]|uniref:hypothetical protein n=1 Tax=Nonomuraea sp. NPDC049158 TaxID=3155649 RepID=UPI0033CD13A2